MSWTMFFAIIVFLITYIFIATEKIHKTLAAFMGGFLMIIFHLENQDTAFSHIDFNVIFLLIGMMLLVKILQQTGGFEYLAIKFAKLVKGDPVKTMVILFFMTAIFSAFLDNITTVLLITPISLLIAEELQISPLPFMLSQIFASNIGGTATLIGDPPNIMIGSAARLTFMDFIVNIAPLAIIQLFLFALIFFLLFRNKMKVSNENRARIMDFDEKMLLKDLPLLKKSLLVFSLVIVGFIIHGYIDLEASTIAFTGSTVLLIVGKLNPEKIFKEVEWVTIFFFIGLFLLVGGLIDSGFIAQISKDILKITKGNLKYTVRIILWFSGIFSSIVDNIPYVATIIPLIKDLGHNMGHEAVRPIWWALSLGACLGGNGTLIGASANVIIADFSKKTKHPITFGAYLKYGIPITVLSLLISQLYLMLRYF